ncbi:alpha/beta fold hydrolase [Vibrio sp. nBUS_14]|uniref:alpha/beta fold hydrolase n=1 Tax=Vibrio sp. nBUS_14 TaxID=3395321 RepID=UPI003EB8A360
MDTLLNTTNQREKVLERDGYQLKIEQYGKGPNLLIVGSVDYYKRVIPTTLHDHFTCLYLDHRGFAQTVNDNQNDTITLDIISKDIEAICDYFSIRKTSILGHSGHAYMALHFASLTDIQIKKVMVVGAPPNLSEAMKTKQFIYWDNNASNERKELLDQSLGKLEQDINKEPHRKFAHLCRRLGPMRWADPSFDELPLWEQVTTNRALLDSLWGDAFSKINLATLPNANQLDVTVAIGELDFSIAPLDTWLPLKETFRSLKLVALKGVSHTPMLESQEEFIDIICAHLLG